MRRSRRPIKNKLRSFSIYYLNVRDVMTKKNSLEVIIESLQPTVVALAETWLEETEEFEFENYKIFRNDRNKDGGGVLLAIRKEFVNIVIEVSHTKEMFESLWIAFDNGNVKAKLGVVYMPQEKDVNTEELGSIYTMLKEEIRAGQKKGERVFVCGDFNCRVGSIIPNNQETTSKGGKKLIKLLQTEDMVLANGSDKCNGLWTRMEGKSKSVIDYIIMSREDSEFITEMIIDEGREHAPYHIKKEGKKARKIFSDHNPMIVKTNMLMKEAIKKEDDTIFVIKKENVEAYKQEIQDQQISKIWDAEGSLQEKYTMWCDKVDEIRQNHSIVKKARRRKQRSKTRRLMELERRKLKKLRESENNIEEKEKIHCEIKSIQIKIAEEESSERYRKVMKVTESICNDGRIDSGSFWKLNKKMKGKKETPHAVLDLKGNKVQSVEEIKKAYQEFYEDLLTRTNRMADEQKDEAHVIEVNRKFSEMMEAAKFQEPADVNREIVHRAILTLKRGKAKDRENWNNEIVIEGGDEMEISVEKMAIEILKEEETPKQWNKMSINSIHKKGPKEKLPNKRGLFLTNIMSKLFEKIVKSTMNVKNDQNQLGGEEKRGTIDCTLLVMAVRDTNKRLRRDTYLFFGDLVKCFDRLWLRDCVVDLYEAGARARDAKMVYLLNKEAQIKIKTPVGTTEEIVVKEIVKQGTIFGPKLCCASTGKINQYSNTVTYISPETYINALTYVDDIASIGSLLAIVETIKGCSLMEQFKFMEFSLEKTKWMRMCLQYGSRAIEQIEERVGQGVVEQTDFYKYVGNWLNKMGNMDTQLEKMEVKAKNIIRECNNMCSAAKVGPMEMQAKILVYEVLIVSSLFYNIEGWSNLRQADKDMLEVLQGKVLKGLIGLPKCTPYWGILYELNIWPVTSDDTQT